MGVIEEFVIDKTAGAVTLTGELSTAAFSGDDTGTGTFDPNSQTINTDDNCDWAADFDFAADADTMDDSTWIIGGNFTADGQTLNATAEWYLQVAGAAVANGEGAVEYSNAGGFTEIPAIGWFDGDDNTNWLFGGAIMNQIQIANVGADLYNGGITA
jgi:hypothetical protein